MNIKKSIAFSLVFAFVSAIFIQSVDSISHLIEEISVEKCIHLSKNKADFTHQHHKIESCQICHFSFSSFDKNYLYFTLKIFNKHLLKTVKTYKNPFFTSHKGVYFSLRAPPII